VSLPLLGSALVLALASSLHCAGMCGAFALVARSGAAWHLGRVLSYVALGAAAGAVGRAVGSASVGPAMTIAVAVVASVVLVLSSLQLAGRLPRGLGSSRAGAWLARPLRRLAEAEGRALHVRRLLFGLANGLIPCGVVYAGLALAAVAGGALAGATVMAAFGLGTLPALVALVLGARRLGTWGRRPWLRQAAAGIALLVGLLSVWTRTPLHAAETPADEVPACHRAAE
jgi:sulfite exporter TauE/SafE